MLRKKEIASGQKPGNCFVGPGQVNNWATSSSPPWCWFGSCACLTLRQPKNIAQTDVVRQTGAA
jgi:hypothetical protein